MLEKNLKLLEESFKKYYFDHFDLIHVPDKSSEREFGYQKFNSGMIRHIGLKSDEELHLMLMENIPSDVYCSNAYYSFPNSPMQEKDWKGADLIFDIDSKDLNLVCRQKHTCVQCRSCGEVSTVQSECLNCKSNQLVTSSLICKTCIDATKIQVAILCKILIKDLGIKQNEIHVYYSGNEGFHIYVNNTQYLNLNSRERAELVDYIMFRGAIPETFGLNKFKPERSSLPDFDEEGWRGRVSKQLFGSKSKRSKISKEIISAGYIIFQKQLEKLREEIGVKIDPNVTMDVHRIFRLAGSLNSKSGLSKIFCENIENFNPFRDACLIDDKNTEVVVNCPVTFSLKNKKFGPYFKEKVEIPRYAAVYLICKGLANNI